MVLNLKHAQTEKLPRFEGIATYFLETPYRNLLYSVRKIAPLRGDCHYGIFHLTLSTMQ